MKSVSSWYSMLVSAKHMAKQTRLGRTGLDMVGYVNQEIVVLRLLIEN